MKKKIIDGKGILQTVTDKSQKKRISLYISESIYKDFQAACKGISASQVIEELMKQFSESVRKK